MRNFLRDDENVENNKRAPKWIIFAALLTADRLTKLLAASYLALPANLEYETAARESARFFSLSLYHNHGISFSLFGNFPLISLMASILGVVILGGLCLKNDWLRSSKGVLFLWAGATGNLTDRLLYGYVIDWFYVGIHINLADVWLCIGCVMFFYRYAKN